MLERLGQLIANHLGHFLSMTAAFGTGGGMGAIHDLTFSV